MLRFVEVSAAFFLEHALVLLQEHRDELATDKARMVLKPDADTYQALDQTGSLMTIAAYRDDELIGYSANLVSRNLHYSDLMQCQNDVLFITKAERKGSTGLRLIAETEKRAKERGAQIMLWHAKPDTNLDKLLQKRAAVQDIIYKVNL